MTWSLALRRYQRTAADRKLQCADAHSSAEKHTAPIQRNVQTRPFYAAHQGNGRSILCHHNQAARNSALLDSPLASPLTWWLYLVSGLISVDSALVLFLSRPLYVLSSPPLTGARALDHSLERTIGSGRVTWPPRRGSALRGYTRSRENGNSRKRSKVKSSCFIRLDVCPFSSASSSSKVRRKKKKKWFNKPNSLLPPAGRMQWGYTSFGFCFVFSLTFTNIQHREPTKGKRYRWVWISMFLSIHPSIQLL